jgi:hypothetical protein
VSAPVVALAATRERHDRAHLVHGWFADATFKDAPASGR